MIQPTRPQTLTLAFPPMTSRARADSPPMGERPLASLPAPRGDLAAIQLHEGLIAAAEREFNRLWPRIDAILHPVA